MAAPRSDVVTTFEVVQAAAIDPGTVGRAYGLFDFDFLEARNIFFFQIFHRWKRWMAIFFVSELRFAMFFDKESGMLTN